MAVFWRLVLAHFMADFALQTDAVFSVKKRFSWGVLLHVAIFALTSIAATGPYLNNPPFWGGLVFLWLFHAAVDKAKLSFNSSGHGDHLGTFLFDQMLHLIAIGLVCLFLTRHFRMIAAVDDSASLIPRLKLGTAYIIAIWVSPVLSFYIPSVALRSGSPRPPKGIVGSCQKTSKKALIKNIDSRPTAQWRLMGYVQRGGLVAAITGGGRLLFLIPLLLLPGAGLWVSEGKKDTALRELVLGSLIALGMGLWGRTL